MKLDSDKIRRLVEYFRSLPINQAFVFGSYARGDADEQSDLDILLKVDRKSFDTRRLPRYREALHAIVDLPVDLYLYHALPRSIWLEIRPGLLRIH